MIVTFCGHSDYQENEKDRQALLALLESRVGDAAVDFLLGEYGGFDAFAYRCCKQYQSTHPAARLIFVTPYNTPSYRKTHLSDADERFDDLVYPPLENVPPKYAIVRRNRYMMEQADLVIAYITHAHGGAHQTYRHALRKGKNTYNLAGGTI